MRMVLFWKRSMMMQAHAQQHALCEVLLLIDSQKSFGRNLTCLTLWWPAGCQPVMCAVCPKRQIQTSNPAVIHLDTDPGKCIVIHVHFVYKCLWAPVWLHACTGGVQRCLNCLYIPKRQYEWQRAPEWWSGCEQVCSIPVNAFSLILLAQ